MKLTRVIAFMAVMAAGALLTTTFGATRSVTTILGTGVAGYSDAQVNNPYGIIFGPDGALYFCDLDNQRIRRFDPKTRTVTTIAGSGEKGYKGDGGPATQAALNMPHEIQFDRAGNLYIAERDNHVIRKVDAKSRIISTVAGTGLAGFDGDGGPGVKAHLRQPHSIGLDRDGTLLICDIGNQRIRRLHLDTGIIETYAGTGEAAETPDGAPVSGTPLRGPRTMAIAPDGDLYLALREGNAILRIDRRTQTLHRIAGTGRAGLCGRWRSGREREARWSEGSRVPAGRALRRRHREPRHPSHRSDEPGDHDGPWHRRERRRTGNVSAGLQAVASARSARRRVGDVIRGRQRGPSHSPVAMKATAVKK